MENEKTILSKDGYEGLQKELKNLNDVILPEVIRELQDARLQGDLSENADYDAARTRQAQVIARIQEIEKRLQNSQIIDDKGSSKTKVTLGSTVRIKDLTDNTITSYKILGTVQADPLNQEAPIISNESPLAQAIMGETKGKRVTVKVRVPYDVEIVEIVK